MSEESGRLARSGRASRAAATLLVLILLYVGTYLAFRTTHQERWERDGNVYVIFPPDKLVVYYLYRPLTYLDGLPGYGSTSGRIAELSSDQSPGGDARRLRAGRPLSEGV